MARKKTTRSNTQRARRVRRLRTAGLQPKPPARPAQDGPDALRNELRTHQIELQMQNEELRRTQEVLEKSRARYSDLFDFAPVGYFMLDGLAVIKEMNFTATRMFDQPPRMLVGRPFASFLAPASRRPFRDFLGKLHTSQQRQQQCEVVLLTKTQPAPTVQLSGVAFSNEDHHGYIRLAVTDISSLKASETKLRNAHEDLRNLAVRLEKAREEECSRISSEVHDEFGQALTLLKLDIAGVGQELPRERADLKGRLDKATCAIDQLIETVQNLAIRLRPMVLDRFGLLPAIKWWAQEFQSHTGIACKLELPLEGIPKMDKTRETAAFRIFQEILTNAARHAQATAVNVVLVTTAGWFICEVRDNGRGIPPEAVAAAKSFGLENMRQRAALLNGEITIQGRRGEGTTIRVAIPLVNPANPY